MSLPPRALPDRLDALSVAALRGMRRGIEKESLRTDPQGLLSRRPHPSALGSALTHPHITTDFAEAQLELVTGVHASVTGCLQELAGLHRQVHRVLADEELLWAGSLPGALPADEHITLARYGHAFPGRLRHLYRRGLALRHGPRMQTISGLHYNWSLPGLDDTDHFHLLRNLRRFAWMLPWRLGASPATTVDFLAGHEHGLPVTGRGMIAPPAATSLRLGRWGYRGSADATATPRLSSLQAYADDLQHALTTESPRFAALGLRDADGERRQVSTARLQLEAEHYAVARPKRVPDPLERPLHALRQRGVDYIELRAIDLDPFEPLGIAAPAVAFLDLFLVTALVMPDTPDSPDQAAEDDLNLERVAMRGRDPDLRLLSQGRERPMREWLDDWCEVAAPVADRLDAARAGQSHRDALTDVRRAVLDPQRLPSARVARALAAAPDPVVLGCAQAQAHRRYFQAQPWTAADEEALIHAGVRSLRAQADLEAQDTGSFEAFLGWYLDPRRLRPSA